MVIDSNNTTNLSSSMRTRLESRSTDSSASKSDATPDKAVTKETASVSLSSEAQMLSRLGNSVENSADVDVDRVAAIKKALADGSYAINAERIAEKMIDQDALF